MKMTVDELIQAWSPAERELLKDLITECKDREAKIKENSKVSQRLLKAISDHKLGELAETLYFLMKGGGTHGNA